LGKDTATQASSSQNADFHESLQLNKTIKAFLAGLVTNFTTWVADDAILCWEEGLHGA
jgi:hypothetical protein